MEETVTAAQPGRASEVTPVTEAARLPDRTPEAKLPSADSSVPCNSTENDGAVSQGSSPAVASPRCLRNRSRLKEIDRFQVKW